MEKAWWSDSEIVLHWLCSKKLPKKLPDSFVSKRIKNWRTNINGDIVFLRLTLLIFLAVEVLLAPWLMNAAFRGRALNGWKSADTRPVWNGSSNQVEQEMYQEGMEAVCMATGELRSSLLNVIDPER